MALLNASRKETEKVKSMLVRLKSASGDERSKLLDSLQEVDGELSLPSDDQLVDSEKQVGTLTPFIAEKCFSMASASNVGAAASTNAEGARAFTVDGEENSLNMSSSVESTASAIFGSTSSIHVVPEVDTSLRKNSVTTEHHRHQLIANAAVGRHRERALLSLDKIRGMPTELVLHLLDLHWNRQHHTFLLTYRPAFMRELVDGGPYCSDLLLNAVFACASKFSDRLDLRADPSDPASTGNQFFVRCDQLLFQDAQLSISRIPTIIALLMLGSTFIARGRTSKGWLYTGYALRMVYDLNLHLEVGNVGKGPEEVEIRRRVFWGAFVCEKLQSLYLGRPVVIGNQDAHVSMDFMDTFEELEPWTPYIEPDSPAFLAPNPGTGRTTPTVTYSVSVFQQLVLLSNIMTTIITKIYFVGAKVNTTSFELEAIDEELNAWYRDLPIHLVFEPWKQEQTHWTLAVGPNRIVLLMTYHFLTILLHRPFISSSRTSREKSGVDKSSWKKCTTAARNITSLALAYRFNYPLRKSSYLLSYALYVACTIHVLNAAALGVDESLDADSSNLLGSSLMCLDELALPNSGVADTANIIRKLMVARKVPETTASITTLQPPWSLNSTQLHQSASPAQDEFTQMQAEFNFEASGHDLLFGFMAENPLTPGLDWEGSAWQ